MKNGRGDDTRLNKVSKVGSQEADIYVSLAVKDQEWKHYDQGSFSPIAKQKLERKGMSGERSKRVVVPTGAQSRLKGGGKGGGGGVPACNYTQGSEQRKKRGEAVYLTGLDGLLPEPSNKQRVRRRGVRGKRS